MQAVFWHPSLSESIRKAKKGMTEIRLQDSSSVGINKNPLKISQEEGIGRKILAYWAF